MLLYQKGYDVKSIERRRDSEYCECLINTDVEFYLLQVYTQGAFVRSLECCVPDSHNLKFNGSNLVICEKFEDEQIWHMMQYMEEKCLFQTFQPIVPVHLQEGAICSTEFRDECYPFIKNMRIRSMLIEYQSKLYYAKFQKTDEHFEYYSSKRMIFTNEYDDKKCIEKICILLEENGYLNEFPYYSVSITKMIPYKQ